MYGMYSRRSIAVRIVRLCNSLPAPSVGRKMPLTGENMPTSRYPQARIDLGPSF
jgi:hypothetical protein